MTETEKILELRRLCGIEVQSNFYIEEKYCPKCKQKKFLWEFYIRNSRRRKCDVKQGPSSWCQSCYRFAARLREYKFKKKCLEYLGVACSRCGYDKFYGALEFHHKDKGNKEFKISGSRIYSMSFDVVKKELDKCIVICANCHRELEYEDLSKFG